MTTCGNCLVTDGVMRAAHAVILCYTCLKIVPIVEVRQ